MSDVSRGKMRPFKNKLCLRLIPEAAYSEGWLGLSYRHKRCQRRNGHDGLHRTRSREWPDGATVSRVRKARGKAASGGIVCDVIVCDECGCGTVREACAGNRAEVRRLRGLLRWVRNQGQQPWVAVKIEEALGRKKRSRKTKP